MNAFLFENLDWNIGTERGFSCQEITVFKSTVTPPTF